VLHRTTNLGVLAHVDAGKTTLTERLLYAAGVIDEVGRVDADTTQTDSLPLERQRGITIKTAVVSFPIRDVTVNVIDTPGHPDFIAEVDRALSVLDGAVLVIPAVEGVQPQARILMRALQRLRIPALIFVNKADRRGADCERTLRSIAERLTPAVVAMGTIRDAGTAEASFRPAGRADAAFSARLSALLAENSEPVLAAYVGSGPPVPYRRLRSELTAQTGRALVHPVYFGSALTGAGLDALMDGIARLLPAAGRDDGGPVAGQIFKIERGPAREKIAYVRMFSGTIRTRRPVRFGPDGLPGASNRPGAERKVTAIEAFDGGLAARRDVLLAGQIGTVWGLPEAQVGDAIGVPRERPGRRQFAPPTLETVVVPRAGQAGPLRVALGQLAEQDPLINVRQDDARGEIYVSLYGEVQKQVIAAALAHDFGVEAGFRETTTVCIERPAGTGAAVERLHQPPNPFLATVGLRVGPAAPGSGVQFRIEAQLGAMPLAFFRAVQDTVHQTLRHGLHGWPVTDCAVALTHSGYLGKHSLGHARFTKSLSSTGEDFRKLTPLVLMDALRRAGTVVCEPVHRFRLDAPAATLSALMPALARLQAVTTMQRTEGTWSTLDGDIPAARVHQLRQQLPGLTAGEGVLDCNFDRYVPVTGPIPERPRPDHNPLNRDEYLQRVTRHANLSGTEPGQAGQ
jgi:ribosomal protection tetracycline resistance protein